MTVGSLSDEADLNSAVDLMAMLGNSKRLPVLSLLVESQISVGQLAKMSNMRQSALSQHLAKLRALQLASTRRDAQTVHYSCASPSVIKILETLNALFRAGEARAQGVSDVIDSSIQFHK